MAQLLIVSPDQALLAIAQQHAHALGHRALAATTVPDARRYLARGSVDLLCLDSLLTAADAERLLRVVSASSDDGGPPVLFFVPAAAPSNIPAFVRRESSAAVCKPIVREELEREMARLLAPAARRDDDRLTRAGSATLDGLTHELSFDNRGPIRLTPTEFRLLRCLMQRAGDFASTQEILQHVWGYSADVGGPEIVRAHVSNIRRKLRDAGEDAQLLRTLPYRGYGFAQPGG